jgi:threonine/homoserine/homoserine lactone efflux protein
MDPGLFLRGSLLGFSIAAAVGPIALLTIRRTLAAGWSTGLASGLGVATADGLYGAVAAFGITAVSEPLVSLARPLGMVGGLALVVIGTRTATSTPVTAVGTTGGASARGLVGAYVSVLALTLANPMTILLFAAVVLSLGVLDGPADAATLTVGFAAGSLIWWVALVSAVAGLRSRIGPRVLRRVTIVSGVLIALFGGASATAALMG